MKSYIIKLIYSILDNIYPFLVETQRRYQTKQNLKILTNLKKRGNNIVIRGKYTIWGEQYIRIGENCELGLNICIQAWDKFNEQSFSPILEIGNNVLIGDDTHIGCTNKIIIKDNVLIARKVCIIDHLHGYIDKRDINLIPIKRNLTSKPIIIGNNVWIGEGACIMPGVVLGNNVIVGANAVVTHSFKENTVIAGVPAKIIKYLNE